MKRTTLTTLMATMMTLAAFLGTAREASADDGYAASMKDFAPVIEGWAYETREMSASAVAKPELACSDEMAELALRGESIADDLDGMYMSAPKLLAPTHTKVAREVRLMATMAGRACGDPANAAAEVGESYEAFAGPMKRIRGYVSRAAQKGWGR